MSLRLEMLQVARLAPKVLGDATGLIQEFLLRQQNEDGGFGDRTGRSDLYYSVFGVEALLALGVEKGPALQKASSKLSRYLSSYGAGEGLDFVHLCCLARCWASAAMINEVLPPTGVVEGIAAEVSAFRAADGGFNAEKGATQGTAYGAFLGLGCYQDLGLKIVAVEALIDSLHALRTSDGVWANEAKVKTGSTNATAAALTVLNNQHQCLPEEAAQWLLSQEHAQGGFKAMALAPIPDLLSTATSLHALSAYEWDLEAHRDKHMDFIDSLWTNEGGFHGNWTDEDLDSEYTFYGLLALGHLSV